MVDQSALTLDGIHPLVIGSVCRNAEFQADLAAACLKAIDQRLRDAGHEDGCSGLPAAFLLELAAVAQLKYWELRGLRQLLPSEVPTASDASADLHRRVVLDPQKFFKGIDAPLARQIHQVWIEHFHWLEPELIEADIVIGRVDEDKAVEALAQLLWQNRHSKNQKNDRTSE